MKGEFSSSFSPSELDEVSRRIKENPREFAMEFKKMVDYLNSFKDELITFEDRDKRSIRVKEILKEYREKERVNEED